MGTASIHEGVRRMRFSSLLERTEAKELTQEAAAEVLGISVRTFRRWAERYEAEGDDGLVDRRMGRRSPRRAPQEELERMLGLFRDKYADFTVKHFHEQLQKRHGYMLGYTVTKLALHAAGLVRKAPKRSAHRKKRPRRPLRGMLLHQDGSRHVWIEGLPARDLIVTMDDATSEVYSMVLVEEEGTASTFQALREVIGEHRPVLRALHRPRQPLFPYPKSWREGLEDATNPGGTGFVASSGSSISQPIRRRRAGAPSGCSARCRIGCRRSCGWPGSRRSKLPTRG
ncbi:helix-turn-helix domain-containing protein [Bradyrhizobium sp. 13971]